MEPRGFDSFTKSVAASSTRRRFAQGALGTLLGGALARLGLGQAEAAPKAKRRVQANACIAIGDSCRRTRNRLRPPRCCRGSVCIGGECVCPPNRERCGNKCIRRNQCCTNRDCPNNQVCRGNRCGCPPNRQRCGNRCLGPNQCCTTRDCGDGERCNRQNHRCESTGPQTCSANGQCPSGACSCAQAGRPPIPGSGTCQEDPFIQTFNTNANGWFAFLNDNVDANKTWSPPGTGGTLTVVNGEGRVAPVTDNTTTLSAASPLGGFSTTFPAGGFSTILDIFLNPAGTADGTSFLYSVAVNGNDICAYLAEYMFQGGKTGADFCVRIGGVLDPAGDPCAGDSQIFVTAGWYRFTHVFSVAGGNVVADLSVTNSGGLTFNGTQQIVGPVGAVGGNRYAWFPHNEFSPLRIKNSARDNG